MERSLSHALHEALVESMLRYDLLADDELLRRAVTDPEAFGAFYRRHERMVLGYFRRRTTSPEVAADLASETFAAALEATDRFRPGPEPASAWLIGIARRTLGASLRSGHVEDRARRRLGIWRIEVSDETLERVEALVDLERDAQLLAWFEELPAEHREAIRARVLDEEDYEVIAGRLKCSSTLVRQRVSRGLKALRARLKEASP